MAARLLPFALVLSLSSAPAWGQWPLGPEFQVNSYTTSNQYNASIASAPTGRFVIAWTSAGSQDGHDPGVFARVYETPGASGPELQLNEYTFDSQERPAVAFAGDAGFAAAWQSDNHDGSVTAVIARRFDANGVPLGGDLQVNTFTTGSQGRPSVAAAADGRFVVAWTSVMQDGDYGGVFLRRYDASGNAAGPETQVNVYTTAAQESVRVAMTGDGGFVVAWTSEGQDGSGAGVFARRYDASGAALADEFQVNTYTTGAQAAPALATDAGGGFIVVWTEGDGSSSGVVGQRFDAAGNRDGAIFQVNVHTTAYQMMPAVAQAPEGGFIVTWTSGSFGAGQDGSGLGIFGRRYTPGGNPDGGEFQVNTYTTGWQLYPVVAAQPGGAFAVAWRSDGQDGDGSGVFGRRLATDLIFADGFESGDTSRWSAINPDGGDLTPAAAAALNATAQGLQGLVDDTAGLYVQDDSPTGENRYRARFYFDTNGFDPGEAQNHRRTRLFISFDEAPLRRVAAVVLRRLGGVYALMGRARLDDNRQADTGFTTIADGEHFVELDWARSSGPDAEDGSFQLWIDGTSVAMLTDLDNSLSAVDLVRLGALSVKSGASGTLFWDEFESRRQSYIGP
jgi:hypothetical protein